MSDTVTTTVTELPESRVRVEAEIAPAEVERRMQQTARKLGNSLRIPGFRRGKVPPPVVIRRLGRDYVLDEAMRDALGSWYTDAVETAGINPVGEPNINFGDLPPQGGPVTFSIEIGVCPTAELGPYEGIEVPRREPEPSDEAIEAELERMRDRLATLETVERAAREGDHLVIDYVGRIEGEPFRGGEGRDQLLELGSGQLIPGFEEQLTGAQAGEQRPVEVTFPEEYGVAELAGRAATFDVTVNEVKVKNLPELDDSFASDAAGFDTLAELREDIASRLREMEAHRIEHEFERDVLDAVARGATIDIPQQLIHARAHELVGETLANLESQGISKEAYLKATGQDEEQLAGEAEAEAAQTLRREAAVAAVIAAENIVASDEDILEALKPSAERGKTTTQKLYDELVKRKRLDRLRADLSQRQAVEWLVEHAKATKPVEGEAGRSQLKSKAKAKTESKAKAKIESKAEPKAATKRSTTRRSKPAKDQRPADETE